MKIQQKVIIGLITLMTMNWIFILIRHSNQLPIFVTDEISNIQNALSFFSGKQYTSEHFGYAYSSGFAVTWPSTIGWVLGGNLFSARIANGILNFLGAVFLGFIFLKKLKISPLNSLLIVSLVWAVSVTMPFDLLYWHGFLLSLGELPAALWFGTGVFFLNTRPMLAAFLLGISVWHGKLLYGTFAFGALAAESICFCIQNPKLKILALLKRTLGLVFLFCLPEVLWLTFYFLKFGSEVTHELLATQYKLYTATRHSISTRSDSSVLEWYTFNKITKTKLILLVLSALTIPLYGVYKKWKSKSHLFVNMVSIGLVLALVYNSYWWFILHATMYSRHFHPALYVSVGLLMFWFVTFWKQPPLKRKRIYLAVIVVFVGYQCFPSFRVFRKWTTQTQAWQCTELYGLNCNDPGKKVH